MADIRNFGPIRHLRCDASMHVLRYRRGDVVKSGRGLAFWFWRGFTSIATVPIDDRNMPLFVTGVSQDFQTVTVQGLLTWRVADPLVLERHVDFSIDLSTGTFSAEPIDQIEALLTGLAQQIVTQYLAALPVREILVAGLKPLRQTLEKELLGTQRLTAIGLELVAVGLSGISPTAELERALQAPTFEATQQKADEEMFERRALAVEKERAIAENELNNKTELARREEELIKREAENARSRALGTGSAAKIEADSEAERIRIVEQAKSEMEQARVDIYRELPVPLLMGLAARDFSRKLQKIEHLNISPDLLATVMTAFGDAAKQPVRNRVE
jgi:regulator of protease activity HflC (stomatin/prohibitin superfamily)